MALAEYLDREAIGFVDCRIVLGQFQPTEYL
jgi:hypothetical protein